MYQEISETSGITNWPLPISPTYQQVGQTCDTIIMLTANPIIEKLCFRVINPSQLIKN